MISSNINRANHLSRVTVLLRSPEGIASGLRLDSVIMTDNIITASEITIYSVLGTINDMQSVDEALRHSFGLEEINNFEDGKSN
jgi:mRNA interferase MazF